jgi:phage terminase Nu1 subunit (DNA packaging protein)
LGELLEGVARVLAANPEIARRLTGLLATDSATPSSLLVTKIEYAERLKYSVRKLDQLIQAGLPTVGKGRALRIPVATADRWVLENIQGVTDEDAALDLEAIANVKRRSARNRR